MMIAGLWVVWTILIYFLTKANVMQIKRKKVLNGIYWYNSYIAGLYSDYDSSFYRSQIVNPNYVESLFYCTVIRFWDWSTEQFVSERVWRKIGRYTK